MSDYPVPKKDVEANLGDYGGGYEPAPAPAPPKPEPEQTTKTIWKCHLAVPTDVW